MQTTSRASRPSLRLEALEGRALMASGFNAPDLGPYIREAYQGVNTAPTVISVMDKALRDQLTVGPLASFNNSTATTASADFQTASAAFITNFDANVDAQLLPAFPNVDAILKLQGAKVQNQLASLDAQATAGTITSAEQETLSATAINSLSGGPLSPLNTPRSGFVSTTTAFENDLKTLSGSLASTASPVLTIAQVQTAADAEATAYQSAVDGSLYTHKTLQTRVDNTVTTLRHSIAAITNKTTASTATATIDAAIATFDKAVLDTTGVFGPRGAYASL